MATGASTKMTVRFELLQASVLLLRAMGMLHNVMEWMAA